jgi:hypothetical protein
VALNVCGSAAGAACGLMWALGLNGSPVAARLFRNRPPGGSKTRSKGRSGSGRGSSEPAKRVSIRIAVDLDQRHHPVVVHDFSLKNFK